MRPTLRVRTVPIVVRPSGIWNSRAPFHNWLSIYKRVNRAYELTILGTERTETDLVSLSARGRSITKYFKKIGTGRSAKAWLAYRGALGKSPAGELLFPSLPTLIDDLEEIRIGMRQGTLIRLYSSFEAFLNCWILNYLLTTLERAITWTAAEAKIATALSPLTGPGLALHGSNILRALPDVAKRLESTPHVFRDPVTGTLLTAPIAPEVNALSSLEFWRRYRNLVVHSNSFCTPRFFREVEPYWRTAFPDAVSYLPSLLERMPVPLFDKMLQNCQLTLYRSALALSDLLEELSTGRRGHPWAPGSKPVPLQIFVGPSPPLLLEGDHQPSYQNWLQHQRPASSHGTRSSDAV